MHAAGEVRAAGQGARNATLTLPATTDPSDFDVSAAVALSGTGGDLPTGPQGPQGGTGNTGAQGPQGGTGNTGAQRRRRASPGNTGGPGRRG